MNISSKLLLLLCLSTTLKTEIINFEVQNYQKICDPLVISHPQTYEATQIFLHLYQKIGVNEDIKLEDVSTKFNDHIDQMKIYMDELNLINSLMKEEELTRTRKHYFREQLIFIRRKIGVFISDKDVQKELSEMQIQLKDNEVDTFIPSTVIEDLSNKELKKLHEKNLQVYVNRLNKIYNTNGEFGQEVLIEKPILFAQKEANQYDDKSTIYFKKEICDIENMLGRSIAFMVEKSTNNLNNAQNETAKDRKILNSFIESLVSLDFNEQFGCETTAWRYLLQKLTPTKGENPQMQLNIQKMIPQINILEEMKKNGDQFKVDIIQRDFYVTFFPIIKKEWTQENLNLIPEEIFKVDFSPIFMNYLLGEVPQIIKQWKYFIKRKETSQDPMDVDELDDKEIDDIIRDLYDLYTIQRMNGEAPKTTDTDVKDIKDILESQLKELMNYIPKIMEDEAIIDLFETENRIKLVLVIKQLLGWDNLPLDEFNMPTFDGLNNFLEVLVPKESDVNEKPIKFLLDKYQIPENIWDHFNKEKAEEQVATIQKQMKTLKKKVKSAPRSFPKSEFDPDLSEEETPKGNVREIQDDIAKKLKTLLFSLTWLKKINGVKSQIYEESIVSDIVDIIDSTESRTQLALFVKGMKDIMNDNNLTFDSNDFKSQINLKTQQKIDLDTDLIKQNQQTIKLAITQKLREKLEHNIHLSDGLLKVWNWSGFFNKNLEEIFKKERGLFQKGSDATDTNLRRGMAFDICFLEQATEKFRIKNQGNSIQKYKNLIFNAKYKKALEKNYNCENIKKTLYQGKNPKIIDVFSQIQMGIRFFDVFSILDNFEIDLIDEKNKDSQDSFFSKALSMSNHKKKYLGKVFHDIYISQLHYRYTNWTADYHNPVENFKQEVRDCVEITYNRTSDQTQLDKCPLDNLNYHEQYNLLAYQRATEIQKYIEQKDHIKQFIDDLQSLNVGTKRDPKYILQYNTVLIHIILLHAPNSAINGKEVCDYQVKSQLCQEHQQILSIITNEGEIPELLIKDNKETLTKLKLYNVLLTIETLYPTYFKQIMQDSIKHQRTNLSQEIEEFINITPSDESWFASWLKINFSNMDSKLKEIRDAILLSYVDKNEDTQELIYTQIMSFTNHSAFNADDADHVLNLKRVLVYLLFSTDMENYISLSNYLGDKAWMVLMVYTEKDQHAHTLLTVKNEIQELDGENFYQKMLKFFKHEDDELIESIEDDIFGKNSSEEEESIESPKKKAKYSQQINYAEKTTHEFGQQELSDENIDGLNKYFVESDLGAGLMRKLEEFGIQVEDPTDFDQVEQKLNDYCAINHCELTVIEMLEQYKTQVGQSVIKMEFKEKLLI